MSVASGTIFAATEQEAALLTGDPSWRQYYPSVEAKDLGVTAISELRIILLGIASGELQANQMCVPLSGQLTHAIAKLTSDEVERVTIAWFESSGLANAGWSLADTRELMHRLIALARMSRDEGKTLYLLTE